MFNAPWLYRSWDSPGPTAFFNNLLGRPATLAVASSRDLEPVQITGVDAVAVICCASVFAYISTSHAFHGSPLGQEAM